MRNMPFRPCINHGRQYLGMAAAGLRHWLRWLLAGMQQAGAEWLTYDFPLIGYLFKYLLASWLALWLALKMEMDQPATALLTVVIVMHFRSGMVMTKSYYRLLGTMIGILFSMLLVAWFAQDRFPFFIAAALWIGLCTAGSLVYRHFQAYGFVLAGYTLCIVGLPATLTPWHTFQIASTRLSEIAVGLLSATLISELVFPQRLWETIQSVVRGKFHDFSLMLGQGAPAGVNQPFLKFMQDLYQLESFRASTQFETDDARLHSATINQLNVRFMAVSTSYVMFQRLLQRLQGRGQTAEADALQALMEPLAQAVLRAGRSASDAHSLKALQQALIDYQQQFAGAFSVQMQALSARAENYTLATTLPPISVLEVETGAELLQRLVTELAAYLQSYMRLVTKTAQPLVASHAFTADHVHTSIDWLPVSIAALRGALTLLILGGLWMSIDWPSGILAMTLGVITSTLFAASPAPMATMRQFSLGVVLGIALVYVSNVFWLTAAHDFVMLCLVISPAILLTAWLSARPASVLVGAGLGIAYFLMVGFNQALGDNPVKYFNDSIALVIALIVSGVLFSLTDYGVSAAAKRRVLAQLRRLVVDACLSTEMTAAAFEIRARDLIQRSGAVQRPQQTERIEVVEALCAALEMGHAVLALRAASVGTDRQTARLLRHTLVLIAAYYKHPGLPLQQQGLQWLDHFLAWLQGGEYTQAWPTGSLYKLTTQLHFMRLVLAAETPGSSSPPPSKEAGHVA